MMRLCVHMTWAMWTKKIPKRNKKQIEIKWDLKQWRLVFVKYPWRTNRRARGNGNGQRRNKPPRHQNRMKRCRVKLIAVRISCEWSPPRWTLFHRQEWHGRYMEQYHFGRHVDHPSDKYTSPFPTTWSLCECQLIACVTIFVDRCEKWLRYDSIRQSETEGDKIDTYLNHIQGESAHPITQTRTTTCNQILSDGDLADVFAFTVCEEALYQLIDCDRSNRSLSVIFYIYIVGTQIQHKPGKKTALAGTFRINVPEKPRYRVINP